MKTTIRKTTEKTNAVAEGLKALLADSYALLAQTHLAHWNVQGPAFFNLHTAFQTQYEELFTAIDEIAERLRALDVLAPGGLLTLAKLSKVEELSCDELPAKDYVSHLIECHQAVVASSMKLRDAAGAAEDLETQDMAIGRISVHEKTLWMLNSYLKNL
jgi:starvation-inducible DNA-binding protein